MKFTRLDKLLANSAIGSRSEVKILIKSGRVSWNGEIVRDPGTRIPDTDINNIAINGQKIAVHKYLYFALHKPSGYITAMEDKSDQTIMQFLPDYFSAKKIAPVGRLDKDTSGLILLTNDGDLHYRLLSPKYEIPRVYYVEIEESHAPFTEYDVECVYHGVDIGSGVLAKSADLEILSKHSCLLTLTEGKYHEVKRIMHGLAKELTNLHRIQYGSIRLDELEIGDYRALTQEEIYALYESTGLDPNVFHESL